MENRFDRKDESGLERLVGKNNLGLFVIPDPDELIRGLTSAGIYAAQKLDSRFRGNDGLFEVYS